MTPGAARQRRATPLSGPPVHAPPASSCARRRLWSVPLAAARQQPPVWPLADRAAPTPIYGRLVHPHRAWRPAQRPWPHLPSTSSPCLHRLEIGIFGVQEGREGGDDRRVECLPCVGLYSPSKQRHP